MNFYRASACRVRYCFTNSVRPSVRLSVHQSRCGTVGLSKQVQTSSNSFHHLVGAVPYFLRPAAVTKFQGTPPQRALNTRKWGKSKGMQGVVDPVKVSPLVQFDHHAKCGCCVIPRGRRRYQKFWERQSPAPCSDGDVGE